MPQSMSDPTVIGRYGSCTAVSAVRRHIERLLLCTTGSLSCGRSPGLADKERDTPLFYTVGLVWLALGMCLFSFFVMLWPWLTLGWNVNLQAIIGLFKLSD